MHIRDHMFLDEPQVTGNNDQGNWAQQRETFFPLDSLSHCLTFIPAYIRHF